LFDERLNPWAMAGIAIVIASVTINTLMKRRWERAASRP